MIDDVFILQSESTLYGIDWNGPLSDAEDLEQVEVTQTANPLRELDFRHLQMTISPISSLAPGSPLARELIKEEGGEPGTF